MKENQKGDRRDPEEKMRERKAADFEEIKS